MGDGFRLINFGSWISQFLGMSYIKMRRWQGLRSHGTRYRACGKTWDIWCPMFRLFRKQNLNVPEAVNDLSDASNIFFFAVRLTLRHFGLFATGASGSDVSSITFSWISSTSSDLLWADFSRRNSRKWPTKTQESNRSCSATLSMILPYLDSLTQQQRRFLQFQGWFCVVNITTKLYNKKIKCRDENKWIWHT